MLAAAATVGTPSLLQAKAKALSASVKSTPPWQVEKPLIMSGRTAIFKTHLPGAADTNSIPNACDARSPASKRVAFSRGPDASSLI